MNLASDILFTGLGVVSPIGIGCEAFWNAFAARESGIRLINSFDSSALSVRFGGQIPGFDPKLYVRPRKSLKVMSREIQYGFAAADLAMNDAGLSAGSIDPDRFGVVFGNDMIYADIHEELHPLWLLKHLPNMTASHIAIAHDARGPNNSIVLGDVSSLLAIAEAASVIQRGWADVMLAGGTGCRLHPTALVARGDTLLSHRADDFRRACRPFDRDRDGLVNGEGAGVIVLESRAHAERRGARIRGRLLATASRCEPTARRDGFTGSSLRSVIRAVLDQARLTPSDIGHVNAHGVSTIDMDRIEASAIVAELGNVPVTAPKSFFGHIGAGGGVVELIASLLGLEAGLVVPTLNYELPDPLCPVQVVRDEPLAGRPPTAIAVNVCSTGQAVAVAVAAAH
ncbi:MAG: beta-ketoacyl-[acyl-carrier-protein] synthase family protein [Planctomycetia bacterium]|nr:beta-ketoacyl-[acyl-carrier-protein] synthase family protein [Planctomycetia bacterium]